MVYVDAMRARKPTRRWPWVSSCHLIADTPEELFAFGDRLFLKRAWFQGDHYDLTRDQQARALKAGATLVTERREFVRILERLRSGLLQKQHAMRFGGIQRELPALFGTD